MGGFRGVRLFGVGLTVNPLLLLVVAAYAYAGAFIDWATVFACLILHELAHAAVASGFGLRVLEIEFTPIGGVARLDGPIELEPEVEAAVAMAGPMNSLVLAGIAYMLLRSGIGRGERAEFFIAINLALAVFNLLPALPLDGGRILRALLAERLGVAQATARVVRLSIALGWLVAAGGVAGAVAGLLNPVVPAVGIFIVLGARREGRAAGFSPLRSAVRKRAAFEEAGTMRARVIAVHEGVPIRRVLDMLSGSDLLIISVLAPGRGEIGRINEMELVERALELGVDVPLRAAVSGGRSRSSGPSGWRNEGEEHY
ncbi:MAG: M50 family metallopeptidase [Firmicutes bacterium]|jgi:stage IV sporulation protein FB|nr:M50 family metallopeptidase [Bacillota bacterium]